MEGLVAIMLLGFGASLGFLALWKLYHVVKSSIEKNKHKNKIAITEEDFDRLARAFIAHKKEMSHRLENIEASVSDGSQNSIQIEASEQNESSQMLSNNLNDNRRVQE